MSLRERCPLLKFADLGDERGRLVAIEGGRTVPFEIQRVFYIYDVDSQAVRGRHANRDSDFVLINIAGRSKVRVTDGRESLEVPLDTPLRGILIPRMLWKEMYDFSRDAVLLVLASRHYDAGEYIRDYAMYLREEVSS